MATAPRPRSLIVLPRPTPGAVRIAVLDRSHEYLVLAKWQTWARASVTVRPTRRGDERWWYADLVPSEAFSLAEFTKAHGPKGSPTRRMSEAIQRAMVVTVHSGGVAGPPDDRPTLFFLHATGCPACEMMKPEVRQFYLTHRDKVRVVPVDLAVAEWKAKKWAPEMTPTLLVRYPDGKLSPRLEGYEPGAFQKWVRTVLG